MELSLVQKIAVFALPVLFAITLHEAAHGYVARHFGDLTAYAAGRVSLNPLRHIDLIGTIVVGSAVIVGRDGINVAEFRPEKPSKTKSQRMAISA